MKLYIPLLLCLFVTASFAQVGNLTLYGRVENKGRVLENVSIEIVKDNDSIIQTSAKRNGSYTLSFELGSIYNIAFSKDGYLSKSVEIIGISPEKEKVSGRYNYQMDIELQKYKKDDKSETLLSPVVRLVLLNDKKGFVYDSDYSKWAADEYKNLKE